MKNLLKDVILRNQDEIYEYLIKMITMTSPDKDPDDDIRAILTIDIINDVYRLPNLANYDYVDPARVYLAMDVLIEELLPHLPTEVKMTLVFDKYAGDNLWYLVTAYEADEGKYI